MNNQPKTLKAIQTEHMIAEVYKALVTDAPVEAIVPEKVFVEHFLPLFCGEAVDGPIGTYSQWADIAQGYYNEVKVISEAGEVVVTVPPLFDRHAVVPRTKRDAVPLGEALQTMELMAESSPQRALNYFSKVANADARNAGNTALQNAHMQAWNTIFKHYGKEQTGSFDAQDKEAPTQARVLDHSDDDLL